jgi:heme A synthase
MLALLALQVVLGGVTVLLSNVAWTVIAHYGGAALLVWSIALVIVGVSDSTAIEVLHSSVASLTWLALATMLSLTWTLAT